MSDGPLVTVSLVAYNGMRWLPGCLAALDGQGLRDFELLAIDNASSDASLEYLRQHAQARPWMSVEASSENMGFAAAQNRNIFRARGKFVLLLNQDVELDDDFLAAAVAAFDGRPVVGAVQARLRRLTADRERSDDIDTTGLEMLRSRRVVSRGQGRPDGFRWSVPGPVWGADGPAPVYRRDALMDAREPRTGGGWEVLDEDFFMYKEDVDLAWRLRRLGWASWYAPDALAWHARTAAAGDATSLLNVARSNWQIAPWIKAISWRNQRLMQIKNDDVQAVARDAPWVAGRELGAAAFVAGFDPARLAALRDFPKLARAAIAKRQLRQWQRP